MVELFENMESWESARTLTNETVALGRRTLLSRNFRLSDRRLRNSTSVLGNFAEGWNRFNVTKRRPTYHTVRRRCGDVDLSTCDSFVTKLDSVVGQERVKAQGTQTGSVISGLIGPLGN